MSKPMPSPAPVGYSTDEVAAIFNVEPASVRHALSTKGHYLGLRPRKLPNRFLSWPRDEVDARRLGGAV